MPIIAAHRLNVEDGCIPVYNGLDSCLTNEIEPELNKIDGGDSLIYRLELAMQAPALEMMLRGFRVDPSARERAIFNTRNKLQATEKVLFSLTQAVCDKDINPNSGMQLKDLFYSHMGLVPVNVSVQGERKQPMDRKVLERLEEYFYARPIVNATLLYRDLSKALQTLETEIDSDWRWRTSYGVAATTTGRWASSKSPEGTGGNAQNITDELRRIFIPDEGRKLCGRDLEQSDARYVGWFCGTVLEDWTYLDMIESGDLHTQVARMCFPNLPWNGDLKKDRAIADRRFYRHFTYRDACKRLGHGSNYLGKPYTMSINTKIPLNIVRPFQERYFDEIPAIPQMHHWVAQELQTKQYLVNAYGRRRDFFDRASDEATIRDAVAYLFQSGTADNINIGLWRLWKYMGLRIELLAQLHDAVYFQYSLRDNERDVIESAGKLMEVELFDPKSKRKFIVPSEASVGFNWAHRFRQNDAGEKEDWNPKGLDKYKLAA